MAHYPKVGEKKTFVPEAYKSGLTIDCERTVSGEVVWIHPKGRFYVVRIENKGHVWHECFMPGE